MLHLQDFARPSLRGAARELLSLIERVEHGGLTDEQLPAIGTRGDVLIRQLCATSALRLADVVTKLEICRLSQDLWDTDPLFDSVIDDMRGLVADAAPPRRRAPILAAVRAMFAAGALVIAGAGAAKAQSAPLDGVASRAIGLSLQQIQAAYPNNCPDPDACRLPAPGDLCPPAGACRDMVLNFGNKEVVVGWSAAFDADSWTRTAHEFTARYGAPLFFTQRWFVWNLPVGEDVSFLHMVGPDFHGGRIDEYSISVSPHLGSPAQDR